MVLDDLYELFLFFLYMIDIINRLLFFFLLGLNVILEFFLIYGFKYRL